MHDWRNYQTCQCGEPGCGSYRPFGTFPIREIDGHTPCGHILGHVDGKPMPCGSAGEYAGFCWSHRWCSEYFEQRQRLT